MTKQELREQIKAKVARMKAAEKDTASLYVCLQIIGTEKWQKAQTVLLYDAMPDEVNLSLLIQDAEGCDKKVLMPQASAKAPILDPSDLKKVDLAIVPGRAFTPQGDRMGRGKGYYDQMLTSLNCPKWGVAFHCQMVKEIATDPWDIKLDKIFES